MAEATGANKETLKALLKEAALGRVSPKMTKKERAKRFPKKKTGPVIKKTPPTKTFVGGTAKDVRLKDIPPLKFAFDFISPVDPEEYIDTYEKKGASGVVKLLGEDAWNHATYVAGMTAVGAAAAGAAKGTAAVAKWLYNKAKKAKKTTPKKKPKPSKPLGITDDSRGFFQGVPFAQLPIPPRLKRKITFAARGRQVHITPLEALRPFYPELKGLSDVEAARVLQRKMKRRPKHSKVFLNDLLKPVRIKTTTQSRLAAEGFGKNTRAVQHFVDDPSKPDIFPEILLNPVHTKAGEEKRLYETLLHELTHAYEYLDPWRKKTKWKVKKGKVIEVPYGQQKSQLAKRKEIDPPKKMAKAFLGIKKKQPLTKEGREKLAELHGTKRKPGWLAAEKQHRKYSLSREEIGPQVYGPIRREFSRLGFKLDSRKDVREFAKKVKGDKDLRRRFFFLFTGQRGRAHKNPQHMKELLKTSDKFLDLLINDKKIQKEFLKYVEAPKTTQIA